MPRGTIVSTEGDGVATARLQLERTKSPHLDAYAEYMSVGPLGAAVPDTSSGPGYFSMGPAFCRLRVTLSSCELSTWLTIDDIVTGRADTRTVGAEYRLHLLGITDLWAALQRAPRVLGPDPTGPPIKWMSPTSFAWVMRADTLVVEQKADFIFQVTVRARVR